MQPTETVVATFKDHPAAESAIKKLVGAGFAFHDLTVVGKGYHTEETVTGFYNTGDRVIFWGSRGAFWGGFWGLFMGGMFLSIPIVGHLVLLGYLAGAALSAIEGAAVVGGASALGAALFSIGIPKDSVLQYEADIQADGFLVMAHGSTAEMVRAHSILGTENPARLELHATPASAKSETARIHEHA